MRTILVERSCWLTLAISLLLLWAGRAAAVVTFDWATVGDPNNAADTLVMTKGVTADGTTGYGSVGYTYDIAKTHVTNTQYTEFLNAVDPDGSEAHPILGNRNGIFNPNMSSMEIDAAHTGGIDVDLATPGIDGSRYSVKSGQENYPATWINWASSARFVNWLHNGQGTGDTENGVYDMSLLSGPFASPATFPPRQAGATVFIPSEDEFYKAAYYDPTKNGGSGGYWEYGVQSNTPPTSEGPSGGATSANYALTDGVPGVSGDTYWQNTVPPNEFDGSLDHLTNVGAYVNATSFYGLHDVDGLLYQWTEGLKTHSSGTDFPAYRGGAWFHTSERNGAAFRALYSWAESASHANYGLRLAMPAAAIEGDFDGDGDVDGDDFLKWQRDDGSAAGLLAWETNYGAGGLAAVASVPEPSSAALLIAMAAAGALCRQRR